MTSYAEEIIEKADKEIPEEEYDFFKEAIEESMPEKIKEAAVEGFRTNKTIRKAADEAISKAETEDFNEDTTTGIKIGVYGVLIALGIEDSEAIEEVFE